MLQFIFISKSKMGASFENLDEYYLNQDLQKQLGGSIIFCQRIIKRFIQQKRKFNFNFFYSRRMAPKFEHYKNLKMSSPIEYSAIKSE